MSICFFFCNDKATTETYTYGHTLSLHDGSSDLHEPHDRQNPGKRVQAGNPLQGEVPLAEPVQFEKSGKSRREGQKGIAGGHVRAAQEGEDAFGRLLADDADAVDLEKGKVVPGRRGDRKSTRLNSSH